MADTIDIGALVDAAAQRYGVDPKLAHAVVTMESQGNPNAYNSRTGATGVMQLMPATAQWLGVKDSWDPVQNIEGGVKYLGQLVKRYGGDARLALAGYNAGPGNVDKYGGVPPFPETQHYVARGASLLRSRLLERPTPAPEAPAPPQQAGIKFEPDVEPPAEASSAASGIKFEPDIEPPATAEPSPLQKAGTAFVQGIGGPTLLDIGKGVLAEATKDIHKITGADTTADEAAIAKGQQVLGSVVQGFAAEPGRVWGELGQAGGAMVRGDIPGLSYHMAGAVPLVGAPVQQIGQDVARGDPAAAVGHTGALVAPFVAGPALRAAGEVASSATEAAGHTAESINAGIRAAAPDVVRGATKAAAGAAVSVPLPGPLRYIVGANLTRPGLAQMMRGIQTGVEAARTAVPNRLAAEAAARASADAAAQAAADAAMRAHVATYEAGERMAQPFSQPQLPAGSTFYQAPPAGTYAEEQRIAGLGPQPSGAAPPAPEAPPPSAPEPAETPGQAYAASQGIDWAKLKPADQQTFEHIARARANVAAQPEPAPPAAPPAAPQAAPPETAPAPIPEPVPQPAPQTPQEIAQALKAEMEQSGTVPPPETPPPSFAETARAKKVDALFDVMTRNKMPLSMVEQFGPKEWDMLAKYAGVNPPSETTVGQLKQRLADYEKARNIPVTGATTPAEAQTAFEQARVARAARLRPPPIR